MRNDRKKYIEYGNLGVVFAQYRNFRYKNAV